MGIYNIACYIIMSLEGAYARQIFLAKLLCFLHLYKIDLHNG